MDVAFVAQTESCTFLLDKEGICCFCLPRANASEAEREGATRCLGAQYVATLDADSAGLLVREPKVGRPMLFARVGERGRVSLVRSGPLLEFHTLEGRAGEALEARDGRAAEALDAPDERAEPAVERAPEPEPLAPNEDERDNEHDNETSVRVERWADELAGDDELAEDEAQRTAPFTRERHSGFAPVAKARADEMIPPADSEPATTKRVTLRGMPAAPVSSRRGGVLPRRRAAR